MIVEKIKIIKCKPQKDNTERAERLTKKTKRGFCANTDLALDFLTHI